MLDTPLSFDQRAALGSLVAIFARVEATVDMVVGHLTNLNSQQYSILVAGKMLGAKLEVLRDIGVLKLRSEKRRKAFLGMIATIASLNAERNTAVHGIWEPDGGYRLNWLASGMPPTAATATRRHRGGKISTLKAASIDGVASRASKAHSALWRFWKENWLAPSVRRSLKKTAQELDRRNRTSTKLENV